MRDLWTSFSVPIVVTGLGLLLAVGLGFAPLVSRGAPKPAAVSTVDTPAPAPVVSAAVPEGLADDVARQGQGLDSLSNRVRTLEKGITRLNEKLAGLDALETAPERLDRLTAEVGILNKAVPRMNVKLARQADMTDLLPDLDRQVDRLTTEVGILNKAVPRMNIKLSQQADATESLRETERRLAFLEGQMRIINAAVPKLQARIVALRETLEN